jgi:hypothetical protein
LEQALQAHELRRLEARFEAGEIEAGFSLLDGLAPELEPELLAELLSGLMPGCTTPWWNWPGPIRHRKWWPIRAGPNASG